MNNFDWQNAWSDALTNWLKRAIPTQGMPDGLPQYTNWGMSPLFPMNLASMRCDFSSPHTHAHTSGMPDSLQKISEQMKEMGVQLNPEKYAKAQWDYLQAYQTLTAQYWMGQMPALTDKRFADESWQAYPFTQWQVHIYLLNSRYLNQLVAAIDAHRALAIRKKQQIQFIVSQMIDAMSPANFLASNPEAQKLLIETQGESLMNGMQLMLQDLQKGRISQTDEAAFDIGKNVATTEGRVVYENYLYQLIQYQPLTSKVYEKPLLIVPPCINKFYILDLQAENSLVRYALEQGHAVFMVSWVNPDESLQELTWDDYVQDGAISAIHTVKEMTKQSQINALGFCIGGTILSNALAVLAKRGEEPLSSLTLLATLLDFSSAGVLEVFIDEMQVQMREASLGQGGLMPGRELASAFSSLRPHDLVWSYVQSNYLKGKKPAAFDLLYWNSDSTNLPGRMFCWYLRHAYLENTLKEANTLTVAGEKLDLSQVNVPTFIFGAREDHIVPWQAAYASSHILNAKQPENNRFVLGASGHIAGVINPASKNKRSYWINEARTAHLGSADAWLAQAEEKTGSWWPTWCAFLSEHAGKQVKAMTTFGNKLYPAIEPAPGRYVKVKTNQ